jgi:DNA-binding beta-propeller fold protein YncE
MLVFRKLNVIRTEYPAMRLRNRTSIQLWISCAAFALAACAPQTETSTQAADSEPAAAPPPPVPVSQPAPAAPAPAASTTNASRFPDVISAQRGGFVPEGIEYDRANQRLLTGSLAEGSIFEIGADGSVNEFITDPALVSSVGIEVDEARDRILVANADRSVFAGESQGLAMMGAYSLTTGQRLAMVDLAAELNADNDTGHFANDVAVADDGYAFVTDTRQNVVYRISPDYEASVHYAFSGVEGIALNGIEWHPDGYLVIADMGNGRFYKLATEPGSDAAMIAVPEALPGADGIVWRPDGALAVVQNSPTDGRVVLLVSDDGWLSAAIAGVATHSGQATTGAAVGDEIYSVQPHFEDQDPPTIRRAMF